MHGYRTRPQRNGDVKSQLQGPDEVEFFLDVRQVFVADGERSFALGGEGGGETVGIGKFVVGAEFGGEAGI